MLTYRLVYVMRLQLYTFALVEAEQLCIQYCHVLGLQCFLLCVEQIILLSQQFHGILHAQVELFLNQIVTGLRTAQFLGSGNILLLCTVGIQPEAFYGLV